MAKNKKTIKNNALPPRSSLKKVIIDECFLLCASGGGCDSRTCEDNREKVEKKLTALLVIIAAYKSKKVSLVIDNDRKVIKFYQDKYETMSKDVRQTMMQWLNGRGSPLEFYTPKSIGEKVAKKCNLKEDKLDPILCGLALASKAPILTLDSDFWCVQQHYPEIKPLCPMEAEELLKRVITNG